MQAFPYTVGRIRVAAGDLASAVEEFSIFLGRGPDWQGRILEAYTQLAVFCLGNAAVEIFQAETSSAYIEELVFAHPDIPRSTWEPLPGFPVATAATVYDGPESTYFDDIAILPASQTRGLPISIESGRFLSGLREQLGAWETPQDGIDGVDHIVVHSHDPDDSIRLFGENGLGLRLALDQTVEAWGGRMLFFRTGGLTIEVISSKTMQDLGTEAGDFYWGIAYKVPKLEATHNALLARGVQVSEIRKGRKPGTIVSTVKSHVLGLPTLLVGPVV